MGRTVKPSPNVESTVGKFFEIICCLIRVFPIFPQYFIAVWLKLLSGSGSYIFRFFIAFRFFSDPEKANFV